MGNAAVGVVFFVEDGAEAEEGCLEGSAEG